MARRFIAYKSIFDFSLCRLCEQARLAAGLTQVELADRLGKSQASIAALERPGANPTLQSLHDAMHATGHRLELRAIPERSSVTTR